MIYITSDIYVYGGDNIEVKKDENGQNHAFLKEPNYIYEINPTNFNPVVTLRKNKNGLPYFEFSEEWVSNKDVDINDSNQVKKVIEIKDITKLLGNYQVLCDVNMSGEAMKIRSCRSPQEGLKMLREEIKNGKLRHINEETGVNSINFLTVEEFIDEAKKVDGVKVYDEDERDKYLNDYLSKVKNYLNARFKGEKSKEEINKTVNFLKENLDRNVKYVIDVQYTDEEINIFKRHEEASREERAEIEQDETYKSYLRKHEIGAGPGGYIQGRVIFSNLDKTQEEEQILRDHETTHSARGSIIDIDTKKTIISNHDVYDRQLVRTNGNPDYLAKTYTNMLASAGYDKTEITCDGKEIEFLNNDELSDLMEICTESMAGFINFYQDENKVKKFDKFWIPTKDMPMSAISYDRKMRDLLIMAIGSDEFISDMLQEDTDIGLKKLDDKIKKYSNQEKSLVEYLQKSGEYAKCITRVESGNEGEKYNKNTLKIYLKELETYVAEIFMERMKTCEDRDKNEQVKYFEGLLENKELIVNYSTLQEIGKTTTPSYSNNLKQADEAIQAVEAGVKLQEQMKTGQIQGDE